MLPGFKEDDTKKDDGINNNINFGENFARIMRHKRRGSYFKKRINTKELTNP
jgi:hypothetical protein